MRRTRKKSCETAGPCGAAENNLARKESPHRPTTRRGPQRHGDSRAWSSRRRTPSGDGNRWYRKARRANPRHSLRDIVLGTNEAVSLPDAGVPVTENGTTQAHRTCRSIGERMVEWYSVFRAAP